MAVGGQRQLQWLAAERAQSRQLLHSSTALAQQRLAACQSDLFDAQANKDLDQSQVLADAQFWVLRPDSPVRQ